MKSVAEVLTVVVLVCISFGGHNPKPGQEKMPTREVKQSVAVPLFAIVPSDMDKSISIDPMLYIDNGRLLPVPDTCTESPALHEFVSQYLRPGKTYSLIFGGVQRGTATVIPFEDSDWQVKLDSDIRIEGFTMALATAPDSAPTRRVSPRRTPTRDERIHVKTLAKEILMKQGVPDAALPRVQLTQVAATKLDGRQRILVSAEVERLDNMGMEYSLFFIADPHSGETDIIWFQQPKGERDGEAIYFLDQLGGNTGGNRVFVRRVFYENYRYEVYKSEEGHWKKEFQSEVLGCL